MSQVFFEASTARVEETLELGKKIAAALRGGDCVLLRGDLGAGKTAFTKGVCEFFGVPQSEVTSPTYSLIQTYQTKTGAILEIHHIDLYRLKDEKEFASLGFDELQTANSLVIVEWAERVPTLSNDPSALVIEITDQMGLRKFSLSGDNFAQRF